MTTEQQALVMREDARPLTAPEIRAQVNRIQEVMRSVMQENTHYGVIPGAAKPSLWKAGAEKLASTFRIALDPQIEDLSIPGEEYRYRVVCQATHQVTGMSLGSGAGEATTNEEKYMWREAVCQEEFESVPEDRRRIKFRKRGRSGEVSKTMQVRTNPADLANTVLKMAKKRAQIDVILQVTAASDIFTQDLEDLPEEIRRSQTGDAEAGAAPQAKKVISEPQGRRMFAIAKGAKWTPDMYRRFLGLWGFESDRDVTADVYEAMVAKIQQDRIEGPGGAAGDEGEASREPGQEG